MMRTASALLLIAALTLGAVKHVPRAAKPAAKPAAAQAGSTVGTWTVESSQMAANMLTGQFSVPVPLKMTRTDGSTVQGDRAAGNFKQKRIALYGHVQVHDVSGSFGLQSASQAQGRGAATLSADQLNVDDTTRLYDAGGNVHYEQGATKVDSQTAQLNDKSHVLTLKGAVHVVDADRDLYSEVAVYNTATGDGRAENNVRMEFPGVNAQIATPRPITIKGPKIP